MVQRAVELTRSAYIKRGSIQGKVRGFHRWSLCLIEGYEFPGKHNLHNIIENLVKYEYLILEENDRKFLEKNYGADPDFLKSFANEKREQETHNFPVKAPQQIPSMEEILKAIR